MEIFGWVVLSWFVGMFIADIGPKPPSRNSGDTIYQYQVVDGENKIVKYRAYGFTTCRPQCYMSGSFKNGVLRPMVPWPFRRSKYFECAKEGDIDYCTGEVYSDGAWFMRIAEKKP